MPSLRSVLWTAATRILGAALGAALAFQFAAGALSASPHTAVDAPGSLVFKAPGFAGTLVLSIRP